MEKANRTTGWLFLASILFAAFSAACNSGGGGKGTGGQSSLGGASGLGGTGNTVGGLGGASGSTGVGGTTVGTTAVKLVVGPPTLTLTEGSSVTGKLSVALDRPYSQPISVTIFAANSNVATVIPETVIFPANTITPQIVEVLAPVDDDTVPNTTTITASSQETGSANVVVNVDDPDVQGLLATPPTVSMTEGRTESVGLRLAKRPASAVVVTLSSSAATKLTLGATTLTFTAANYSVPQNVSLTALQDEDAMAEHVTVKATATGNIKDLTLPVEVIDDDAVNLDISPSTSLTLIERAMMPGTFKVALTRAPAADVTVSVVSSNTGKVTVTPANLAFTIANFSTPQTVTVAAVPDDDARDDTATVTFSSPGITSRDGTVLVDDMDNQALKVLPAAVSTTEGGMTTFTVALALKPDGDTTVNVFSQNPGKLQVSPPVLHFDATDFAVPKTVTVQALEDDDLAGETVKVTLIGSAAANVNLDVTIADNDTQSLMLIPAGGGTSLVMQETRTGAVTDSTSALGVRLAYRPADLVTIVFTSSSDKVTVLPSSVTFVPSDFATPKVVTLTAKHDIDMLDDNVTITASASTLPEATLKVTVLDVDVQNLDLSGAPPTLAVTEHFLPSPAFTMAPLKVRLNVQPPSNVVVNFASSSPKVTVPASCTINGGAASGDAYITGCTVQVAATPDNDGRDETATITVTASVAGTPLTPRTVPVTVDDTDTQEVLVSAPSVGPIDEGSTATFTVRLKLNPVDPVNVSLFASDPAHFSVSPPTLTFAGTATQLVTVTALNDDDMKSYTLENIMVQGAAAGASPAVVTVGVSSTNKDVQSIVVTPGPTLTILEGSTTQLGVRLAYRPEAAETVTLSSADPTKLTTGATVAFSTSDYATNKFVTLNALADPNVGSHTVNVTATSSLAPTTPATVNMVTITDIDTLNFVVSHTSLGALTELGATTTFTVGLTATPMAPVVVTATSSLPTSITALFSGSSTCTLATSSSNCTVTVAAIDDANALNENVTITLADLTPPAGGLMRPVAARTVSATTMDTDMQGLVVSAAGSTLTIHEKAPSNSATFTVKLLAQPAATTTVTLSVMPAVGDGITISPSTLTFTTDNYGTTQTVTVMGVADNDLRTDPFSIRITAPALGVPDQFVNVSEIDDDTQAIVLTNCAGTTYADDATSIGTITEGDSSTALNLCVRLKYQPLSNTVVNVNVGPGTSIVNLSPVGAGAINFTTLNYDQPFAVTISAGPDGDTSPDIDRVINLTSSGFAATRSIKFSTKDNDNLALVFTGLTMGKIDVAKGASGSVSVNFNLDPVTTASVFCSVMSMFTVTIDTPTFSFTGGSAMGNYATPQNIVMSVAMAGNSGDYLVTCSSTGHTPMDKLVSNTFTVHVP